MTIALEQLADNSVSDRNFQKLMRLVLDTGGLTVGIRFGTGAITWPGASAFSNNTTITHGLGKTPLAVLVTLNVSLAQAITFQTTIPGATTFVAYAAVATGTNPTAPSSMAFSWAAIG